MQRSINWLSLVLTLLALSIVYVLGSAFFIVEIERLLEQTITPHILASPGVSRLGTQIFSGIEQFMQTRHVRLIGYSCIAVIILAALAGLITGRNKLAAAGSFTFIFSVYAYFVLHMSFLAGLGVLTALWTPFWGELVRLGDIVYLPYMALVYPFSLVGIDIRRSLSGGISGLGLLIFMLGVMAWFYARSRRKSTADFWIYRFTRHPQYLGWIVWSYGLLLQVSLRHDTVMQAYNPGASLPWVISTLIILCVALAEEVHMRQRHPKEYQRYQQRAPFLLPMPGFLNRIFSAPFRVLAKKEKPENHRDLVLFFFIYLIVIVLLSLPFILLKMPAVDGWVNWPF